MKSDSPTPSLEPGQQPLGDARTTDQHAPDSGVIRGYMLLQDAGWTVVRLWEHEDPDQAAERVRSVVAARREALKQGR